MNAVREGATHWRANPTVWMLQVNGMIVDVRHLPREVQEEAFARGMSPMHENAPGCWTTAFKVAELPKAGFPARRTLRGFFGGGGFDACGNES
jgi:hypothetical protein